MEKKNIKNGGFTMVEALIAISILSLSIAATFTAVQNGIQGSSLAKDQTTAFYLAQESMEYIKNIRDENALYSIQNPDTPRDWLYGISALAGDPCYFGKVCQIDSPLKTITSCGSAPITSSPPNLCAFLNQNNSSSLFGYTVGGSWVTTRFKREIQFSSIVASREVEVVITISWTSKNGTKSFQASERLFNRQ